MKNCQVVEDGAGGGSKNKSECYQFHLDGFWLLHASFEMDGAEHV
jgi:hypothetical protein